ncbi:MAG TPA: methyltransferase [Puia sp.]|jgi:tRNA1Val (adenine37-N6)-methyltransferase
MPNSYFRFKQFTIQQDRCSMKVCTDSCILGAWTASRLKRSLRVLDIGAGTGLLTLMLAQKNQCRFDAIELDRPTFEQAAENIRDSPWADRIGLFQGDVRNYPFLHSYDFIISNPPFFESGLPSPFPEINKARRAESLPPEELISVIRRLLNAGGAFSLLLPFYRTAYVEKLAAEKGFFLQEKLLMRQTPAHGPFRSALLFSDSKPISAAVQELALRSGNGVETDELLALLQDYYLR